MQVDKEHDSVWGLRSETAIFILYGASTYADRPGYRLRRARQASAL